MSENLLRQLALLPINLSNHLKITVIPLAIGVAISLPLAVLIARRKSLRYTVLTVVSVVQTVPSLALLALMVPLLTWIGAPALGLYPTVIALTLYSILPMLRNTVTGLVGVDPAVTEAAKGLGMTQRQILWKVEFPLAAPVILAGIRTATVWVVGTATLSTPVGQRSLGNYIFSGLQTRNSTAVIFGCVAAAALAVLLDFLIGALEKSAAQRRRGLGIVAGLALFLVFSSGLIAPSAVAWWRDRSPTLVIGSKTFTEQYILAELIEEFLEENGLQARKLESLGSTVGFDALVSGEIDVFIDYSGTIWANYMKQEGSADRETVLQAVDRWLTEEHGIQSLGSLGFENAYALAMRRDQAERLGIRSIGDLARQSRQMAIGGDYEFFERPEWRAIVQAYGLHFAREVSYDSTFMYEAVARGDVDVISAFTTDGRIEAFNLILLEDPEQSIPPYDALLLLSQEVAKRPEIVEALQPLVGAIDAAMMREANGMVDDLKRSPRVASEFLRKRIKVRNQDREAALSIPAGND